MKLFKKAREALKRLTGNDKNLPQPAPAADPVSILPEIFDPLPEYQQRQRDFEARAKATTVHFSGGTNNFGQQRMKRAVKRRQHALHGVKGGWKKTERLNGIGVPQA